MFAILIVNLGFLAAFYIRHTDSNTFICTTPEPSYTVLTGCASKKDAVDVTFQDVGSGRINVKLGDAGNHVFDFERGVKLITWPRHNNDNQQFALTMMNPNRFTISTLNNCFEYDQVSKHHLPKPCTYKEPQLYMIVPNEKEIAALSNGPDSDLYVRPSSPGGTNDNGPRRHPPSPNPHPTTRRRDRIPVIEHRRPIAECHPCHHNILNRNAY